MNQNSQQKIKCTQSKIKCIQNKTKSKFRTENQIHSNALKKSNALKIKNKYTQSDNRQYCYRIDYKYSILCYCFCCFLHFELLI